MSTHNICFRGEIRKIFTGYPPLSKPTGGSHIIWFILFQNVFCGTNQKHFAEALLMSSHNMIYFYGKIRKIIYSFN